MKALTCTGAGRLEYGDAPAPSAAGDLAVVQVVACGICGSDMHAYRGHDPRRPPPVVLGHEAAGIVVANGGAQFPNGARVVVNPLIPCGQCRNCRAGRENICPRRELISMPPRPGAFAEQVAVPPQNLTHIPDDFPLEKAALAEPLACGFHAARVALSIFPDGRAADMRAVVLGGGGIGWGAALNLRAFGVGDIQVAEPNPLRREMLAHRDEFPLVSPDDLPPAEADIVLDAVGIAATRAKACETAAAGGRIVHIGLGGGEGGTDARRITLWEITLAGVYCYTADDFAATVRRMLTGELGDLEWVEHRPLSAGASAFADLLDGKVAAPKVALLA